MNKNTNEDNLHFYEYNKKKNANKNNLLKILFLEVFIKMNCKNKSFMTKRKAFTLIELLIVIAIIGILFIVLVSKVDFATDKAKATGVQTDFRSFQMAFDTVAKENAGFNTFGWDTGDANQNGKRDSYDEGDNGAGGGIAKNGIQDGDEVFTGHKVYDETFTKVFSLKKNGTGSYDRDALNRLETAINANLDPKLHITIKDDGEIVMANGAQDPWNKEYHGWYITNAEVDKKDRGAIIIYSDGANNEFGSAHTIANGVVSVTVPNSNKAGKDDYSIVSCYTYLNGYGEVKNTTTGFSNNQNFLSNNSTINPTQTPANKVYDMLSGNVEVTIPQDVVVSSEADFSKFKEVRINNEVLDPVYYTVEEGSTIVTIKQSYIEQLSSGTYVIEIVSDDGVATGSIIRTLTAGLYSSNGVLVNTWDSLISKGIITVNGSVLSSTNTSIDGHLIVDDSITSLSASAFYNCDKLLSVELPENINTIPAKAFRDCQKLERVNIPKNTTSIATDAFLYSTQIKTITVPTENTKYKSIDGNLYSKDGKTLILYGLGKSEAEFVVPESVETIAKYAFYRVGLQTTIVFGTHVKTIEDNAFGGAGNGTNINLGTIKFNGTQADWSTITKTYNWVYLNSAGYSSAAINIICNDTTFKTSAAGCGWV